MLTGLIALLSVNAVFASTYTMEIVKVNPALENEESVTVFANDGRVYEIELQNKGLIEKAILAQDTHLEVQVKLSDSAGSEDLLELRNKILSIELLSDLGDTAQTVETTIPRGFQKDRLFTNILENDYITDVASINTVESLFRGQRRDTKRKSQCYNRAHVWAYEMSAQRLNGRRVQMGKMWIFFTSRYIRDYKYKWWFHISPYLTQSGRIMVMDRTFLSRPADLQYWTDQFISTREVCKTVRKYSDYELNQRARNCFLMKTSVHYWQPWQIKNAETRGEAQTDWNRYEIKKAYRNAIGRFSRIPDIN